MPPEKHLPYFLLLDALRQPGCAICRRAEEAVEDGLKHILHELVTDGRFRDSLLRGRGFCREHAWQLADRRDVLGTAILFRDQVLALRRAAADAGRGRVEPKGSPPACPACATRDETAAAAVAALLSHLGEDEVRTAFEASDGLCAEHFRAVIAAAGKEARALVAKLQERSLSRLEAQLDELIRKQDYRHRDEPAGEEESSWLRAVAASAGLAPGRLQRARSRSLPPQKRRDEPPKPQ